MPYTPPTKIKVMLDAGGSGAHTTNWTGIWASAQSGNVGYQKIGDEVTLFIPSVQSTSTVSASIEMETDLPLSLRPATEESCTLLVETSTGIARGKATISAAGEITIYADVGAGSFNGTSTEGIYKSTIKYNLN